MNNTLRKNKVCAVIPFFNESKNINMVINRTLQHVNTVIAVNDGSNDDSIKKIPASDNVIVLSLNENKGKGTALNLGFIESIKRKFDITVTLDADMQHNPDFIPQLIKGTKNFDIVIGNRMNDLKKMPSHRILSNKITSFILSLKTGVKIYDGQCGFRAYRTEILTDVMPSLHGFEAESEILVLAVRKNFSIGFVSIPTIYNNKSSKMTPFKAILGFLRVIFT